MPALFIHCRADFESDCAAEIMEQAHAEGVPGYCRAEPGTGYVLYQPLETGGASSLVRRLSLERLVFTRQWFVATARVGLPGERRAESLVAALGVGDDVPDTFSDLWVETPDSPQGRRLSRLAGALHGPVRGAWTGQGGRLNRDAEWRAHFCLAEEDRAYVGIMAPSLGAPWPSGIPRLRRPRGAPSRAALKLEEALVRFLTPEQRARSLHAGEQAVDLGAAPGGWSWVLARHGLHVVAVDNGPLHPRIESVENVRHVAADGFRYRPAHPVAWVVCDMLEQPYRVAARVAEWLVNGWARQAVVTLKLPMRKRHAMIRDIIQDWASGFEAGRSPVTVRVKHLYHNRQEVTAYLARAPGKGPARR